MGCGDFIKIFSEHIPILTYRIALAILITNILFPGIGTICLICLGGLDYWIEHLMIGLIQLFCTPFIFGWIWSLIWGIYAIRKST